MPRWRSASSAVMPPMPPPAIKTFLFLLATIDFLRGRGMLPNRRECRGFRTPPQGWRPSAMRCLLDGKARRLARQPIECVEQLVAPGVDRIIFREQLERADDARPLKA